MAPIDFQKMRKELIVLYNKFLEGPENDKTYREIVDYHLEFAGLTAYNERLKSRPVPKDVENALHGLSTIYQYGMWEDSHIAFSNEKIIQSAKKILQDLKKEDK